MLIFQMSILLFLFFAFLQLDAVCRGTVNLSFKYIFFRYRLAIQKNKIISIACSAL